jgi:FMN phosphatase YigB (HAD superfamily)
MKQSVLLSLGLLSDKKKKVLFIDFFDTVVFRYIHSSQIFYQWAKVLCKKLEIKQVSVSDVVNLRYVYSTQLSKLYEEPPYDKVMELLFAEISKKERLEATLSDFIRFSYEIEVSVELGCQFPNSKMISFLKKEKEKGVKLYIVSDFYLPERAYYDFLQNINCEHLFDKIYVSEAHNKTKRNGSLYSFVLNDLQIDGNDVLMIGDSKFADVFQANRMGVRSILYFPVFHKISTNICRVLNLDFSKSILKKQNARLYSTSVFGEYASVLYYFTNRLYLESNKSGAKMLSFLSRGGFFLMKLFDEYQKIVIPECHQIQSKYCYVSRKSVFSANEDYNNGGNEVYNLFKDYIKSFIIKNDLYIVDEGWYCHSQLAMRGMLDCNIYGFYLGIKLKPECDLTKGFMKGLLFDIEKNEQTSYSNIFNTNASMYEQMLTSSEGSVRGYKYQNDNILPILEVNKKEFDLYQSDIENWQRNMMLTFRGFCAWLVENPIKERDIALQVLKTTIFSNNKRCDFLNKLDASRFDNASNGLSKTDKGIKDAHINMLKLFCEPSYYLGVFCKLQRKIYKIRVLRFFYYMIAIPYYCYILFFLFFKKN